MCSQSARHVKLDLASLIISHSQYFARSLKYLAHECVAVQGREPRPGLRRVGDDVCLRETVRKTVVALRRLVANLSRHLLEDSLSLLVGVKDVSHLELDVTSPAPAVPEDEAHGAGERAACERDDEAEHDLSLREVEGAGFDDELPLTFRDLTGQDRVKNFHENRCREKVFEEHVVLWGWGVIVFYCKLTFFARAGSSANASKES